MLIRCGTHADVGAMIDMGRALHAESPRYRGMTFAPEKLKNLAARLLGTLSTPGPGGVFVAEKDGEIIGMLVGYLAEVWFGYEKIATDYTFYVKPEHRGSTAAVRLLKQFEEWAIKKGAVEIMPGVSTRINLDRTQRFYENRGYQTYGVAMIKEVK